MRITVLGATGRTGRHILREGVLRGHELTAFTRRPEALTDTSRLAAVVVGDGRDPQAVRRAVAGADAVIAIVAADSRRGPHHAAAVANVLSAAMTDCGARRLTVTSAYPIVAHRPRLALAVLRRLFAEAYTDAAAMERIFAGSGLDWTVVRLNRLTDEPARGAVTTSRGQLDRPASVSRVDAARLLLDIAADDAAIGVAVNVAGAKRPHRAGPWSVPDG